MARRIEIELTSARPDGTWTWRAAGALKPRGVLDGSLLYEGAKAGDVVRADADFELEGIVVVAVLPPKDKKRNEPERLEVVGPPREPAPGVTTSLTSRPDQRRDRPDDPRRPRRDGEGPGGRGATPPGQGRERRGPGQPPTAGSRPDRVGRERPPRPSAAQGGREGPGRDAGPRPARGRPDRPPAERSRERTPKPAEAETPARPKARRLNPGNAHRSAVLDSLPPEQRPIAEQVLRGGIPAVRTAIHLEREKAAAEGRQAPNAEALLAIAEELLPRLKAAEWHDRAEAAAKIADELSIRDLRSVVAGADAARDDESRQLAVQLREALERRVEADRQEWLDEVSANLDEGRVVRALRVSARPPDPASRLPAELATRLTDAAAGAMAPDTPSERWLALLEAVAASPVRRSVKPAGLPTEPGEPLLQAARQSSGRVPALAAMLGISMPPPPGPVRPAGRPPRAGRAGGGRPAPGGRSPMPEPARVAVPPAEAAETPPPVETPQPAEAAVETPPPLETPPPVETPPPDLPVGTAPEAGDESLATRSPSVP